jgi:hypothetical protein
MQARSRDPGTPAEVIRSIAESPAERLSHPERVRLALEILSAYAHARLALRRAPIEAAVASLRQERPPVSEDGEDSLQEALRLGRAVTRLLCLVPGDTRCLARSLVLTKLLASRDITARLVIGAATEPEFRAHAWVEYRGEPVLDPGEDSLGRLVEL